MIGAYRPGVVTNRAGKPVHVDYHASFKYHEWRVLNEALAYWQHRAPLGFDRATAREMLEQAREVDQ